MFIEHALDEMYLINFGGKIGIISPYKSQVCCITSKIQDTRIESLEVKVDTVDSFQGGEKEIILFSTVRDVSNWSMTFVDDIRRPNVVLSRSRSAFVLFETDRFINSTQVLRNVCYNVNTGDSIFKRYIYNGRTFSRCDK